MWGRPMTCRGLTILFKMALDMLEYLQGKCVNLNGDYIKK